MHNLEWFSSDEWDCENSCEIVDKCKPHITGRCSPDIGYYRKAGIMENKKTRIEPEPIIKKVDVRWFDGYLEVFECSEVRFGSDLLFLRLKTGLNRHIPVRQVRWYSIT